MIEAEKAASDYDSNLSFGWNEQTQQWCVFIKAGTMPASKDRDFPVLGFQNIPSREEVQRRLYESDAFRKGVNILREANKHNDELLNKDHSDVDGQTAEAFEWGFRKMGKSPYTKVYMPGDK